MKLKLFVFTLLVVFTSVFSQHSATITVKDVATSSVISGAKVILGGITLTTPANGEVVFTNLANGNYNYTVSNVCYVSASGSITISDADAIRTTTIGLQTVNDVNVSLTQIGNNPLGFTINLKNAAGTPTYNQTIASGNPLGDYFSTVPYGTYNYTISKDCYQSMTGTVTVNCNEGNPNFIFVTPIQTNDVNVSLTQIGNNPLGFTINLTNAPGTSPYTQTIASGNPLGDYFSAVPFGTYNYIISKDCYQNITGSVIVNCNGGIPNYISATPTQANDVDVSLSLVGNNPLGYTINLTNNGSYDQTIASGNPLGDYFSAVPYGSYTYTITQNCNQTVIDTGTEEVNCNEGLPNSIDVIVTPKNDVNVSLTQLGNNPLGFTINLTDGETYNQTIPSGNPLGDYFSAVPFGTYNYTISKDCYQTITGTVTVNCNEGVPNSIFVTPKQANNVIFAFGGLSFNPSGLTINLKDAGTYDETIQSGNPLGDGFYDVAYGEYDYTVTGSPCYETLSGHLTVGCNGGEGVVISDNLTSIAIDTTVTQEGNVLTANLSGEGITYKWYDAVTFAQVGNEQTFTATANGTYYVKIILGDGACNKNSAVYTVSSLGIEDNIAAAFFVYPNPAENHFVIEMNSVYQNTLVQIINLNGQIVFRGNYFDTKKINMNVSDLSAGFYIININADNSLISKKFIKR